MNIDEITKKQWKVSKDLTVNYTDESNIVLEEQELIITKCRNEPSISISCADQVYITQLSKSKLFILEHVLISRHNMNAGFILEVRGKLAVKGLAIRTKTREYTPEQLKQLQDRAKRHFSKQSNA